jgi:hypothetical protein
MTRAYKLPMKIPATARWRLRITASPCHDEALADAIAEARVGCLGKTRIALKRWQRQLNNFRLPEIQAKPPRSQQRNQSHLQSDGYISARARFLANAILSTDGIAKAYTNTARRAVVCRARLLVTQERLDG